MENPQDRLQVSYSTAWACWYVALRNHWNQVVWETVGQTRESAIESMYTEMDSRGIDIRNITETSE